MGEQESAGVIRTPSIPARANVTTHPKIQPPEMMEMSDSNHQTRSISFDAAHILKEAGYQSVRVAGSGRPVDIITWKEHEILFLVVKRSSRSGGIAQHADEVFQLVDMVRTGVPGVVHFWIYQGCGWDRYQIMPGGALPVEWSGDISLTWVPGV